MRINVHLECEPSTTYRCTRAAQSVDLNIAKKLSHDLQIDANVENDFSIGLIVGASGSGKTTLAHKIYGPECFDVTIDVERPIIEQLPDEWSYDDCVASLTSIGLSSVPCWIRPVKTLSNGQRARAEAIIAMTKSTKPIVIDEFTSVVDRIVAKVMAHCVAKYARKFKKQIVLLSCHYDVIEWLDPDWIIDCNTQHFIDRRLLRPDERKRKEQLTFNVQPIGRESWKYFSKYHYLSDRLPGGDIVNFGLFHNDKQIGFQCFANYVPFQKQHAQKIYHSNRTVVHPDYQGFGLGIKVIDETSRHMTRLGHRVMAVYTSEPVYRAMSKNANWQFRGAKINIGKTKKGGSMDRSGGFRENVKTYHFQFVGA